jgi:hypothetical protein
MLNIKDHISEIIYINNFNNFQFISHFIENTNIITYIQDPKIYKIGLLYSFLFGLVIGQVWIYFNNSIIGKLFINYVYIYILKYISRRILNISLFWKLFILLFCVFIVIDVYHIYNHNVISFDWNSLKVVLSMTENNTNPVVDASNSVVNVKNPIANISVPLETAQVASTAFSTAAGMRAGLELAKNIPGIGTKAAVIVGTSIAAQAVNIVANKILKSSASLGIKKDFMPLYFNSVSQFINVNKNIDNEKYSEYPYNLIPDLDTFINIEIWFIIILINVLLTAYLLEKQIDINKFIKNERLRKLLNYMYNRYISVWSVSRNLIVIWCISILLLCIFMSKWILFILLSV